MLPLELVEPARVDVAPGAVWLKHELPVETQKTLVDECRRLMDGPARGYVPTVRGGGKMHVRMVCLGRHWNAQTYRYTALREDYDNAPVAPVPESWIALASAIAAAAGFAYRPDLCIVNYYDAHGRM